MAGLEGCELLGAAGSVVKEDVSVLVDWNVGSAVEDILGVARSAGSISVEGLTERVDGDTDFTIH